MVGVPGKYKGCETCRRRRVKCSNERPLCQKCINSGRECEGYEREMVFITGTVEAKGRVASHPKKSSTFSRQETPLSRQGTPASSSQKQPSPPARSKALLQEQSLTVLPPFTCAWNGNIELLRNGTKFNTIMVAMHVPLQQVVREDDDGTGFRICLPEYSPLDLALANMNEGSKAQCLISNESDGSSTNFLVFFFENNLGAPPQNLASFPNHQFFVTVYRPMAIGVSLFKRRETFLAEQEWTTIPWEKHPKSCLDELLDLMAHLSGLLARTDRLFPVQATLNRRQEAQRLLFSCLTIESELEQWLEGVEGGESQPYWEKESLNMDDSPFFNPFIFKDGATGLMFLYYWMTLIELHGCIHTLHTLIFQPVVDSYSQVWPNLPLGLETDLAHYHDTKDLAANVCRGLNGVLTGVEHPDLLVAPMMVVMNLYRGEKSHDEILQIMWLESFRDRLMEKGRNIAGFLQRKRWCEISKVTG